MKDTIGISIIVPKYVRDHIAKSAAANGRSMSKQMLFILTKEADRLAKKEVK